MKPHTWFPILVVLLVVFAVPAMAEEAPREAPEAVTDAAFTPMVQTPTVEEADAVPAPEFLQVALCNCTLFQPCSIPCPSSTQTPVCVNLPCLSISSQLNGVCKCL
jgi:hypothetical protein